MEERCDTYSTCGKGVEEGTKSSSFDPVEGDVDVGAGMSASRAKDVERKAVAIARYVFNRMVVLSVKCDVCSFADEVCAVALCRRERCRKRSAWVA